MRSTSFNVRFQKTYVYRGKRGNTYWVRWTVAGQSFKAKFRDNATLAESYRSKLVAAARDGEAFDLRTGEPVSWERPDEDMSFYEFACKYVDYKWADSSAKHRSNVAEALAAATIAMLPNSKDRPADKDLRRALRCWAFNKKQRDQLKDLSSESHPHAVVDVLEWVSRNTRPVGTLADVEETKAVLRAMNTKLDGRPRSSNCARRNRSILFNVLEYSTQIRLLVDNPVVSIKDKKKALRTRAIDRRQVVNLKQARLLLNEVGFLKPSGENLVALFATMYYSALRPEEAVDLRVSDLELPEREHGWGTLHVRSAAPHAGGLWTDSGKPRDERGLKQRADDDVRPVPCPPDLTRLLQSHLARFGRGPDNRVFAGPDGGEVPEITMRRSWKSARENALTVDEWNSPLARRPYDLRHACVSTWLSAGVPVATISKWAGHSVAVLLEIYAHCLDGDDDAAKRRIEAKLNE